MRKLALTNSSRTLDRRQNPGDLVKPVELIAVKGSSSLGIVERRIYNILIQNAFGPALGEAGQEFKIETSSLTDNNETLNELEISIDKLMQCIVTVQRSDGSRDKVQLLGSNNLTSPDRPHGTLTYSIPDKLAEYLNDSKLFARLEVEVLRNFTSKYALSFYEQVSQWIDLKYIATKDFSVEELRDILGVPEGKLTTFGNLNRNAIKPALLEVNALADFTVSLIPTKTARKITGVRIGWAVKDETGKREAYKELQRPKVGRMARITGTVEVIE
ncbi:MAG: replication initiation protein [Paracoccaceae bacterium]